MNKFSSWLQGWTLAPSWNAILHPLVGKPWSRLYSGRGVECSLAGNQFSLFRATLFKKVKKSYSPRRVTQETTIFFVVISYIYIDNFRLILKIDEPIL